MRRSKVEYYSASIALLSATVGTTLASFLSYAGSTLYIISVFTSVLSSAIYIVINATHLSYWIKTYFLVISLILLITVLHYYVIYNGDGFLFPLLRYISIGVVLFVFIVAGNVDRVVFSNVMYLVAVLHSALILYALSSGVYMGDSRFATDEFGTAVWAEIAAGTVIASVLSRRAWLAGLVFLLCGYVIIITQMRTAALIVVIVIVVHLFAPAFIGGRGWRRQVSIIASLTVAILSFIWINDILDWVSEVLLLDDPYRGLSSGFSGRGQNIAAGWMKFLDNPLIGYGFSDPVVTKTHNGYVLLLAQFGLPLSLIFIYFFILSVKRSVKMGDITLISCILGLSVFYLGQPRTLNFQAMPLVGIFAVARGLSYDGMRQWWRRRYRGN